MMAIIPDRSLVRYACVAHLLMSTTSNADPSTTTVLAEFNTGNASLRELALECLLGTPPNHSIFSHNLRGCAYTFLIEDPFVFFSISDEMFSKSDRILLLGRMRDALQDLTRKRSMNWRKKADFRHLQQHGFASYCFQGDLISVFNQLLIPKGGVGGDGREDPNDNGCKVTSGFGNQTKSQESDGESKRWEIPSFSKKKKKGGYSGDNLGNSRDMLVKGDEELSSSDHGPEISSREIINMSQLKGEGVITKEKARKWRFYVWVILTLDLAVCMILFGIWLMICHGFHCLN